MTNMIPRWGQVLLLGVAVAALLSTTVSADPVRVFWTNGWQGGQGFPGTINRVNRDGTGAVTLLSGLQTVGDIEVDPNNGQLYFNQWTRPTNGGFGDANEGLWRSDLDGGGAALFSNASNTCSGFASGSHGISLDLANEVVYFTRGVSYADCSGPEISRINFDGTGYTQLNGPGQDGWFLSGVDVDSANARVYWGSPGVISGALDGAVNGVNTDGTAAAQIVPHTNGLGRAMALDPASGTIFFTAWAIFNPSAGGQIWRVNTDGTGLQQLLIPGLTGVTDIEVDSDQQRIWFTDYASGTIRSANFDGTNPVTEFGGLDFPLGLALEFAAGEPNVPDGEQVGYTTSGSLRQAVAASPGDVCTASLWVGKRSDGLGTWGGWNLQLTNGTYIFNVLNSYLFFQSLEWADYDRTFTVPLYLTGTISIQLTGFGGWESYDLVELDCGAGDLVTNGSFEEPLIPDGQWSTAFGNPPPDDWIRIGGAGHFNPNTTQFNDFF